MPSVKNRSKTKQNITTTNKQQLLFPLIALALILWVLYRLLFNFSTFFDETIGKAVFFALPVAFYVAIANDRKILTSFSQQKIKAGLLYGLAVGGLFGFVFAILAVLRQEASFDAEPVYLTSWFWRELALAVLTSFWETLFFFTFFQTVLMDNYKHWSLTKQAVITAFVFLFFHLANIFNNFTGQQIIFTASLLFSFALGQALFFSQLRNAYAAMVIQTIWGMVLLVYF